MRVKFETKTNGNEGENMLSSSGEYLPKDPKIRMFQNFLTPKQGLVPVVRVRD